MTDATSTKFAHLSEIDPAFANMKDAFDAQMSQVSPFTMGTEGFKQAMIEGPKSASLPDGTPERGRDIETFDSEVQVRDGTSIGTRTIHCFSRYMDVIYDV